MNQEQGKPIPWTRKLVVPMIAGAICGGLVAFATTQLFDTDWVGAAGPSRMFAGVIGALYVLLAVGVLVGAMSPALGEKYLQAEDADELREQQAMLVQSSFAMLAWGIGLFLLSLAAPVGPLAMPLVGIAVCVLMLAGIYFAWQSHRRSDELFAAVNSQATVYAYYLMFLVAGGWAVLAHLAVVPMFQPIDLITTFFVVALLAAFAAAGQRGMMVPR